MLWCFSDILTPLSAIGIPFEIDDDKGPLIEDPIRSLEQVPLQALLCVSFTIHLAQVSVEFGTLLGLMFANRSSAII